MEDTGQYFKIIKFQKFNGFNSNLLEEATGVKEDSKKDISSSEEECSFHPKSSTKKVPKQKPIASDDPAGDIRR